MKEAILIVAAHPDDEVLGCGGSAARWSSEGHAVHALLLADGVASRDGYTEAALVNRIAAANEASRLLGLSSMQMERLPDNRLDTLPLLHIVKLIEAAITKHSPARVLTHHAGDVNVDHRIIHDAVLAACRPQPGFPVKELLFFEVASSTEWRPPVSRMPFAPSVFVDISATLATKLAALKAYEEELRAFPHPRSLEAVKALAQWRGASAGLHAAEAFELGRLIL